MKILIADRGEISARISRTCIKKQIKHVRLIPIEDYERRYRNLPAGFTEIYPIKKSDFSEYGKIIKIAKETRCNYIHPGYGPLAEDPEFAALCKDSGIAFIGPEPPILRLFSNKMETERFVESLNIPTIPKKNADSFPLIIKSAIGGGGRGIRLIRNKKELTSKQDMIIQEFLEAHKHIEIQMLSDGEKTVCLGSRDCSVQRKNQKIIEDAPAISSLLEKMRGYAHLIVRSSGLKGLCTVEFLAKDKPFFLEVNPRIQVESSITEMVTGLDLISLQLDIASGKKINLNDTEESGHSLECRVYAEDMDFIPAEGRITHLRWPEEEWLRIESDTCEGMEIDPDFNNLLGLVIVNAPDRDTAIERMRSALNMAEIEGVETNIETLQMMLDDETFLSNEHTTDYLEKNALTEEDRRKIAASLAMHEFLETENAKI